VVRPVGSDGRVELLAASGDIEEDGTLNLSQSLLSAAMEGEPVQFKKTEVVEEQAASILQYSIEEALCIPIKSGQSVVGCIYADNRDGQVGFGTIDDDIEFCTGLAEFAALAMSNLMRMDIERRHAEERQGLLLGTVAALVSAIDAKDTYTCGHSERVAWLSKELARKLELDATTIEPAEYFTTERSTALYERVVTEEGQAILMESGETIIRERSDITSVYSFAPHGPTLRSLNTITGQRTYKISHYIKLDTAADAGDDIILEDGHGALLDERSEPEGLRIQDLDYYYPKTYIPQYDLNEKHRTNLAFSTYVLSKTA
jgi:hypothetical protein